MRSLTESKSHVCQPKPPSEVSTPILAKMSREELIERISAWQDEHGRKRRYGTGSIFQAANGTWYGFITVARDGNGERVRKKLTGRSREEVDAKLTATGVCGNVPAASRPVSNRSYAQLRRLYYQMVAH
jgi:hypothetical protein